MRRSGHTSAGDSGGRSDADRGAPWSRAEAVAFTIFAASVLGSLFVLVHPWYDPMNDASRYIATARSLLAGEGYSYLGMPFHVRPPGFSVLIAPVLGLFGTSFPALNGFVSLFGAAGVILLYLLVRPRLGWVLALAVGVVVWLNPRYQQLCNQVMSDVPATTLMLVCLLAERWASRAPSRGRAGLLGLIIGLASYVRTANLLLLPAILAARWIPGRAVRGVRAPGRAVSFGYVAIVAGVALAVLLPWAVRNRLTAAPPPEDQGALYSYSAGMFHRDKGDPGSPRLGIGDLAARAGQQTLQVSRGLASRLEAGPRAGRPLSGPGPQAETGGRPASPWSLLVLAGAVLVLGRRREPSDLFALLALVVVLGYFGYQDRLLLPVYVLLLPAAVAAIRDLGSLLASERAATWLPLAALLFLAWADFEPRSGWNEIRREHRSYETQARQIEALLAADARIAATQGPHYEVYLDRPVFSLKHAVRRARRIDAVEEVIDRYGINTVVLAQGNPDDRRLIAYFLEEYRDNLSRSGQVLAFRVRH